MVRLERRRQPAHVRPAMWAGKSLLRPSAQIGFGVATVAACRYCRDPVARQSAELRAARARHIELRTADESGVSAQADW
jgi:hypothetical protein